MNVETGNWKRLADMPEARSAAPSMAMPVGASSFLMLGGVPVPFLREQVAARPEINGQGMDHPGFPASILSYNIVTDRWAEAGSLSLAGTLPPVTTPVVFWDGKVIIPTGEIKPGVRSPQVLIAEVGGTKLSFGVVNWIVVVVYLPRDGCDWILVYEEGGGFHDRGLFPGRTKNSVLGRGLVDLRHDVVSDYVHGGAGDSVCD